MRKLSIFELTPGMVLGEDILNFDRQTILSKGTPLTDAFISRIELNGILDVLILEENESIDDIDALTAAMNSAPTPGTIHDLTNTEAKPAPGTIHDLTKGADAKDVPPGMIIPPLKTGLGNQHTIFEEKAEDPTEYHVRPTYSNKIKRSFSFQKFKAKYNDITDNFKMKLNEMVEKNVQIDTKELLKEPLELISTAGNSHNTLDMLHNMREYDDLTFAHSMNVALLNYVAAGWLGWNDFDKELAMACGLLHDIGKLKVSHAILTKPGKLDDEEYSHIQKHPIFGYKLLKSKGLNDHIINSALMHHERYDGSGYPLGIKGDEIDRFAKLTAVSDVYDAMTAARCYRGPLCPFRVIEIFENEGFEKYETQYILSFLSNVGETYLRNGCILSDGREAEIIMINPTRLSRPVVRTDDSDYLDLKEYPDLTIASLI